MKKIGPALLPIIIICFSLLVSSCGKKGCTDEDATTYSKSAKRDDGTCRYEGSNVFWISKSSAQQMLDSGIQSLTVYVDGDIEGQITLAGQNYSEAPSCGAAMAVTVKKDLFSVKNRAFAYRVLDDQSVKHFAGTFNMNGNTCENFEFVYFP